jgi:formate/nitrite transporter FocA (FNT family)
MLFISRVYLDTQSPLTHTTYTHALCPPSRRAQIISCGSELFTGNTALCFTAWLEGKTRFSAVLKNWVCAYAGNIAGCALMVALFCNTGLLPQLSRGAEALALYKTAAPFKEVGGFTRQAGWPLRCKRSSAGSLSDFAQCCRLSIVNNC